MSRLPRKISETGIYHVVFRGVNHCHLFEEAGDYEKFLGRLHSVKEEMSLEVYAYCLMSNHVHLLLKEQASGDITRAMRKLLTPYASWFNRKYQRSGALIANRYKSECVEDDAYLLTLLRYIHQNPISAGIEKDIADYQWSSYRSYTSRASDLVDKDFIMGIFSDDLDQARKAYVSFHKTLDETDCSLSDKVAKPENQIRNEIAGLLGEIEPHELAGLPKRGRDTLISMLRGKGYSVRQIERVTGVSRGIVARCKPE